MLPGLDGLVATTHSDSYAKQLAYMTVPESHPRAGLGDYARVAENF